MSQTPADQPLGQAPQQPPPYSGAPQQPPPYGQAPAHSGMTPADERLWGLLAHLSWILGAIVAIAPLGPLVVFLVYKDRSPFVREHAAEALNLWITIYLVMAVSVPLMFVLVGFVTFAVAAIAGLVLSIVAAVAANGGERYRYPLVLRLVH